MLGNRERVSLTMPSRILLAGIAIAFGAAGATAKAPDCSGPEHYPASMAYVYLKDAGIVGPESVDFPHVQSRMIVSDRIRRDLWRQVYRVTFPLKSGPAVEAIVINDASTEECSMATPHIFLVAKEFPGPSNPRPTQK